MNTFTDTQNNKINWKVPSNGEIFQKGKKSMNDPATSLNPLNLNVIPTSMYQNIIIIITK